MKESKSINWMQWKRWTWYRYSNQINCTLKNYHMSNGHFCIQLHWRKKKKNNATRISKSTNIITANCSQYQSCPHTHTHTRAIREVDLNRQKPTLEMKKKVSNQWMYAVNSAMFCALTCICNRQLLFVFLFNFITGLPLLDRFV